MRQFLSIQFVIKLHQEIQHIFVNICSCKYKIKFKYFQSHKFLQTVKRPSLRTLLKLKIKPKMVAIKQKSKLRKTRELQI